MAGRVCDHGDDAGNHVPRTGATARSRGARRPRAGDPGAPTDDDEEWRMPPLPAVQPSEGPELVQLLTPEGERVDHPHYRLELSEDDYRGLYRDLVMVRRIDFEAMALQRQGELGLWASLLGQEAAQVGSGRALTERDFAFPTYREHGVAFCKGVDPVTLLGLFRGVNQGGWDPYD